MAPLRALSALAAVAALGGANAVVYNYVNGGQDWNVTTAIATGVPLCGTSTSQSPIDIPWSVATYNPALKPLNVTYGAATSYALEVTANYLEMANINTTTTPGANITANAFTDGLYMPDGTLVPLNQFHFHTPSEHSVNGMHYPMEMHMVHKLFINTTTNATIPASQCPASSTTCKLSRAAVIGVMFAYDPLGNNGTFMSKLSPIINKVGAKGADDSDDSSTAVAGNMFDLMAQVFNIIGTQNYYNYVGSLTTPGCNEGINWFVMQNPMYASPLQILEYTRTLAIEQNTNGRGSDNRLVQPLNGRPLYSSVPLV